MAKASRNQKKHFPLNNGSKNAPLKGKEILSLLKNQKMETTMQALLANLKRNEAEALEINEFLDSLIYRVEKGETVGLLRILSVQQGKNQEHQINFGEIQSEDCSLEELKVLDLTSFPSLSEQDPLKYGVEKAMVAYIKAEFSKGLKGETGKIFSNFVRYNHTSLSELLNALEHFPDELNNLDQKSDFCAFRDAFRISFFQLKEQLATGTLAIPLDELNTQPFSQWTESQKVVFDTMFTKLFLKREKGRLTQLNQLTQEVGQLFSKPLPLASLCSKYPCSYEGLQQRATTNRPEVLEAFKACEQRRSAGEESAEAEMEQLYRQLYLEIIKEQNPGLALALTLLYEHDFDFLALEQDKKLKAEFFSSLTESRIEQMEKNGALELFSPHQEQFKQFFRTLWDYDKEEFELNGLRLSIKKTIRPGAHLRLKSLAEFSAFGALPLDFSIEILNSSELNIETIQVINQLFGHKDLDNTIKLSDNEIGKVVALFIAMQPKLLQQHDAQSEETKKLEKFFSTADEQSKIDNLKKELNKDKDKSEETPEDIQDADESPEERKKQFLEAWKAVRGENTEDRDGGCRGGAVLYCSRIESLLPPYNDSHEWTKLEISNVNWEKETISFRPKGTELKLDDDLENKSLTFSLEDFKNTFLLGDKLLDKPFKFLTRDDTFETTLKKMQTHGICDEKVLGDAQLENGKLMLKELNNKGEEVNEEVKYFGTGLGDLDNKALYKIEWKNNGMVKLSSEELLDKKGKVISYEQTMSYSDFLLFVNEKKLIPKTEKIAKREKEEFIKDIESKQIPGGFKWMSIHSLVSSVKTIWKKVNEGLDNYQKEQDQACLDWLTQDVGIYKKLENALGWLAPSLKDSLAKLHDDEVNRLEKDTWKEIEEWITVFSGIEFADVFETGFNPASGARVSKLDKALGKRGTLKNILISRHCVINDNTLRPIMAAAMISNLKEGKGLYRGMPEYDNQGLWVQCLFGEEHYRRFLQYKRMIQEDINKGGADADQLRDLLVKSEINYIVYNIQNSHGKDKYLGSVTDKDPIKNAPRQILKKTYSNKFAGQLNEAAEQMTGQAAIENAYSKSKKMNTFDVAYKEFEKCIKSGRIESGIGVLQRMGELKKTKEQGHVLSASMSYVTMSGIIDKYAGKDTIEWFDGLARSLMLPTTFFANKNFHQHYAWYILDQVPVKPRFSKVMQAKGLTEAQFSKKSAQVPYGDLRKYLAERWLENAEVIDNFFLSLKTKDHSNDPILNKVKDVLWEQNPDNLNASWRGKPKITGHYALNQTPATIEQNKSYNKSGFDGKDEDERNEKAEFWKSLHEDLERNSEDPEVKPDFFLRQFKTWFARDGFSDANDVENISMLRTIAKAKKDLGKETITFHDVKNNIKIEVPPHQEKDIEKLIWYLFEGKILKQGSCQPPLEFKKVLDFFVNYFIEHLEEITSDKVMKKVFDAGALEAEDAQAGNFVNWEEYNRFVGKEDNLPSSEDDFDPDPSSSLTPEQQNKRIKVWKKRYYKMEPFINRGLVDMEKYLKKINVSPPKLVSFGVDRITSS